MKTGQGGERPGFVRRGDGVQCGLRIALTRFRPGDQKRADDPVERPQSRLVQKHQRIVIAPLGQRVGGQRQTGQTIVRIGLHGACGEIRRGGLIAGSQGGEKGPLR